MTHFFTYTTDDMKEKHYQADTYITRQADKEKVIAMRAADEETERLLAEEVQNAIPTLPSLSPLHWIMILCGAALIFLIALLTSQYGSLIEGLESSPLAAGGTVFCLGILIICIIFERSKQKKDGETSTKSALDLATENYVHLYQEILDQFGCPEDVDYLWLYTLPEGNVFEEVKVFELLEVAAWRENELLHLATEEARYTFPLTDLKDFFSVKKSVRYYLTDSDDPMTDKRYLSLTFQTEQGDRALAFTETDEETLEALLGITPNAD